MNINNHGVKEMSGDVNTKILEIITKFEGKLPEVLTEYLEWCHFSHMFWIGIGLIAFSLSLAGFFWFLKRIHDDYFPFILFPVAFMLISFMMVTGHSYDLFKLSSSPTTYLIDNFKPKG